MKNTAKFLLFTSLLFAFTSCTFDGPAGPEGSALIEASFQNGPYPAGYSGCTAVSIGDGLIENSNFSSSTAIITGYQASPSIKHRSLVKFDIYNTLPAGAKIKKAFLELFITDNAGVVSFNAVCHDAASDWLASEATWIKSTAVTNWAQPGGDLGQASDTVALNQQSGRVVFELNAASVQSWLDPLAENRGVIIKSSAESGSSDNYMVFGSSITGSGPKLTLYYTLE